MNLLYQPEYFGTRLKAEAVQRLDWQVAWRITFDEIGMLNVARSSAGS
jgi:hypothetical protein